MITIPQLVALVGLGLLLFVPVVDFKRFRKEGWATLVWIRLTARLRFFQPWLVALVVAGVLQLYGVR